MRASADSERTFRCGLEPYGNRMGAGIAVGRVDGPNLVTLKSREQNSTHSGSGEAESLTRPLGLAFVLGG